MNNDRDRNTTAPLEDVFKHLTALRLKFGITQLQVAEIMDTTSTAICRLETGGGKRKHSPSVRTIKKYAAAIGYEVMISLKPLAKIDKY